MGPVCEVLIETFVYSTCCCFNTYIDLKIFRLQLKASSRYLNSMHYDANCWVAIKICISSAREQNWNLSFMIIRWHNSHCMWLSVPGMNLSRYQTTKSWWLPDYFLKTKHSPKLDQLYWSVSLNTQESDYAFCNYQVHHIPAAEEKFTHRLSFPTNHFKLI